MDQDQTVTPKSGTWKTLAIIGLVLGILALVFSFIPCLGMYAIFPGVIAIGLAVASLVMAGKVNAPKGMGIAALVCAVLGSGIAAYQYTNYQKLKNDPNVKNGMDQFKNAFDSTLKAQDSIEKSKTP
jgi:multidrug transporter EmrE-like cation transporter